MGAALWTGFIPSLISPLLDRHSLSVCDTFRTRHFTPTRIELYLYLSASLTKFPVGPAPLVPQPVAW